MPSVTMNPFRIADTLTVSLVALAFLAGGFSSLRNDRNTEVILLSFQISFSLLILFLYRNPGGGRKKMIGIAVALATLSFFAAYFEPHRDMGPIFLPIAIAIPLFILFVAQFIFGFLWSRRYVLVVLVSFLLSIPCLLAIPFISYCLWSSGLEASHAYVDAIGPQLEAYHRRTGHYPGSLDEIASHPPRGLLYDPIPSPDCYRFWYERGGNYDWFYFYDGHKGQWGKFPE